MRNSCAGVHGGLGSIVHRAIGGALSVAVVFAACTAAAQAVSPEGPVASPATPPATSLTKVESAPPDREWYGLGMIVRGALYIGMAAVGQAADSDEFMILGVAGGVVDGLFGHVVTYYGGDEHWTGLGKGLLSVSGRGGLVAAACFAGSGCSEVSNGALTRMLLATALTVTLDSVFLAYKPTFEIDPARATLLPWLDRDTLGASWMIAF